MIIPDINLPLYAYDAASPFHVKAAAWWQECLSGTEPVGLPPVVLFGFVRLGTNARAFQNPMTPSEAAGHVRSWLKQPPVELLDPPPGHVESVLKLTANGAIAGTRYRERFRPLPIHGDPDSETAWPTLPVAERSATPPRPE